MVMHSVRTRPHHRGITTLVLLIHSCKWHIDSWQHNSLWMQETPRVAFHSAGMKVSLDCCGLILRHLACQTGLYCDCASNWSRVNKYCCTITKKGLSDCPQSRIFTTNWQRECAWNDRANQGANVRANQGADDQYDLTRKIFQALCARDRAHCILLRKSWPVSQSEWSQDKIVLVFLSAIGQTAYTVLQDLCRPNLLDTKTHDELKELLEQQYNL